MSEGLTSESRPAIERRFRLQFEPAQGAHVLLYPEGMIQLNQSAGEILKRCTGTATLAEITTELERAFATAGGVGRGRVMRPEHTRALSRDGLRAERDARWPSIVPRA